MSPYLLLALLTILAIAAYQVGGITKVLPTLFAMIAVASYYTGGFSLTDSEACDISLLSMCLFFVSWIYYEFKRYRLSNELTKYKEVLEQHGMILHTFNLLSALTENLKKLCIFFLNQDTSFAIEMEK